MGIEGLVEVNRRISNEDLRIMTYRPIRIRKSSFPVHYSLFVICLPGTGNWGDLTSFLTHPPAPSLCNRDGEFRNEFFSLVMSGVPIILVGDFHSLSRWGSAHSPLTIYHLPSTIYHLPSTKNKPLYTLNGIAL